MPTEARIASDYIEIVACEDNDDGVSCIAIECYSHDEYKALPPVLECRGKFHTKHGYGGSYHKAWYTDKKPVAKVHATH